jgi:hypothetical protein
MFTKYLDIYFYNHWTFGSSFKTITWFNVEISTESATSITKYFILTFSLCICGLGVSVDLKTGDML